MQEFLVGDKVRLEGVISRLWGDGGAWVNFTRSNEETGITREEMAHATLIEPERKPRYDWSNIPPEYDWAATDRGGAVYAYKNKPFCKYPVNFWIRKDIGDMFRLCAGQQITKGWRDSLEQRPEAVDTPITPCKGTNCGSTTGVHSHECEAEHIAAITGVTVENKALDLSKPILIVGHPHIKVLNVSGPTLGGYYLVDGADGMLYLVVPNGIENIPEPKRIVSRQAVLVTSLGGAEPYLTWSNCIPCGSTTLAHINVIHTEGEGWSVEEVE